MLSCDRYCMPKSLEEALGLITDSRDSVRVVAGATDILPWAREGRAGDVHIPTMVDVSNVEELCGWSVAGGKVRIGANIVFQEFLTDASLSRHFPEMPYCAVWFADDQIRQQATVVGNIVNASPAADGTPALLLHDAEIETARISQGGIVRRRVPLDDFVLGPGLIDLGPGEIVTAVICDSLAGFGGSFQKVGHRRSLVISAVCVAACIKLDETLGRIEDVRLAAGGIGPVPIRLNQIESQLTGQQPDSNLLEGVSLAMEDIVASRSRREYRRTVLRGFIESAVEDAVSACLVGSRQPEMLEA